MDYKYTQKDWDEQYEELKRQTSAEDWNKFRRRKHVSYLLWLVGFIGFLVFVTESRAEDEWNHSYPQPDFGSAPAEGAPEFAVNIMGGDSAAQITTIIKETLKPIAAAAFGAGILLAIGMIGWFLARKYFFSGGGDESADDSDIGDLMSNSDEYDQVFASRRRKQIADWVFQPIDDDIPY
jgi:preprotein translocase subunit Sss1